MKKPPSFTPAQLAELEKLLCPSSALLALEEEPGGCDDSDQGEDQKPEALLGTRKDDLLEGGAGLDNLVGLNGDDTLLGLQGKDWLYGDSGRDLLDGGEGRDFLYGGKGSDELRGGKGRDDLFGENGNDLLIGGCGPDLMDGGRGNDVLIGGNAPDSYTGGLGRDIFVLALPGGGDDHGGGGHETVTPPLSAPSAHEGDEGEAPCTEGLDVVTDFKQGTDYLALAGGLRFEDLTTVYDAECGGTLLFVMSESDHEEPAVMTPMAQDEVGRRLAFLQGFTSELTKDDFLTCSDLG